MGRRRERGGLPGSVVNVWKLWALTCSTGGPRSVRCSSVWHAASWVKRSKEKLGGGPCKGRGTHDCLGQTFV